MMLGHLRLGCFALLLSAVTRLLAATSTSSYDPLNRLTNTAYAGGSAESYSYDPAGNRLQRVITVATQISPIGAQTVTSGVASASIPFTVSNPNVPADSLTVSAKSGNATLLPKSAFVFGGSGTNRTLTITPAASQVGTTTATVIVSDGSAAVSTDFQVTVRGQVSGTVNYYTGGATVPGVVLALSGDDSQSTTTGTDGAFSFALAPGGNYTIVPSKTGDSSPSAGITSLDIALIRRHILGIAKLDSPYKMIAADVNDQKTINSLDIALIRRLILGITNNLPAGLWKFLPADFVFADPANPWSAPWPTNRTYSALASNWTGQDFVAIKLGDVYGGWAPTPLVLATAEQAPDSLASPSRHATKSISTTLSVGNQTAAPGEPVAVSVGTGNFRGVTSLQFTLRWDPAVLEFLSVSNSALGGVGAENFNTTARGKLAFAWDDPAGLGASVEDGGVLFSIQLRVIAKGGAVSAVSFGDLPTLRELTTDLQAVPADWRNGMITVADTPPARCIGIRIESGAFRLRFTGVPGKTYVIQASDSLDHQNWVTLGVGAADAQGLFEYADIPPSQSNARFYRVVLR
ncbi:hypothetical protein KGQ27_00035 [Patescibacteria group bacterium]|nr:hypothetical protein [Patescibacteria group bacterium]MDE1946605.1 hypothetical protein [Patescibacteria group bacterium]